jgi:hypothetical protein
MVFFLTSILAADLDSITLVLNFKTGDKKGIFCEINLLKLGNLSQFEQLSASLHNFVKLAPIGAIVQSSNNWC